MLTTSLFSKHRKQCSCFDATEAGKRRETKQAWPLTLENMSGIINDGSNQFGVVLQTDFDELRLSWNRSLCLL